MTSDTMREPGLDPFVVKTLLAQVKLELSLALKKQVSISKFCS